VYRSYLGGELVAVEQIERDHMMHRPAELVDQHSAEQMSHRCRGPAQDSHHSGGLSVIGVTAVPSRWLSDECAARNSMSGGGRRAALLIPAARGVDRET
jgi:hypothetical protein